MLFGLLQLLLLCVPKLDQIFATHGIPAVIRSDNGPPFTSHENEQYMEENGITHQKITPLWPQANSEAENFMKPLTKAIHSAHVEAMDKTFIHVPAQLSNNPSHNNWICPSCSPIQQKSEKQTPIAWSPQFESKGTKKSIRKWQESEGQNETVCWQKENSPKLQPEHRR